MSYKSSYTGAQIDSGIAKTAQMTTTSGKAYTFPTTDATLARTDAAQTFTGDQTIDGNLFTGGKTSATPNGGDVQVSKGLSFPATQVPCSDANTLDDYEEGTWTPYIAGNLGGDSGQVYAQQIGYYTKVGNLVTCYFRVALSTKGTLNGGACGLNGWPFTAKAGSLSFPLTASNLSDGATIVKLYGGAGASGFNYLTDSAPSNITDTTVFEGSVSYQV